MYSTLSIYRFVLFSVGGAHRHIMSVGVSMKGLPSRNQLWMILKAARMPNDIEVNCSNWPSVLFFTLPCQLLAGLIRMFKGLLLRKPRGRVVLIAILVLVVVLTAKPQDTLFG